MDVIKPIIDTKELIAKENILKEFDYAVEQEKKIENVSFENEELFEKDFYGIEIRKSIFKNLKIQNSKLERRFCSKYKFL